MVWREQSLFNLGEVSPGAGVKPNSGATVAGLQELRNALVRYDNVLERRPGSTVLDVSGTGLGVDKPKRGYVFATGGEEYLVVLTAYDTFSIRRIFVYKKDPAWGITPIDAFFIEDLPYSTDFPDIPGISENDWAPHPFTEAELEDVSFVEYNDRLYILHPEYLPIMLQPGKNKFGQFLAFDAWRWSVNSFGPGPEIGSENRNPLLFTFTTRANASYARVACTYPIFRENIQPSGTLYGAVWRVGMAMTGTDNHLEYGQFWQTERYIGPSVVDFKRIVQTGSSPSVSVDPTLATNARNADESTPNEWAGPWIDTGSELNLNIGAISSGDTDVVSTPGGGGRERIGQILLEQVGSGVTAALLVVDATASDFTVANIGPDLVAQTLSNLHIMEPPPETPICIMSSEDAPSLVSTPPETMTFWRADGLPANHDLQFQNVNLARSKTAAATVKIDVGGTVFVNGGVFRVTGRAGSSGNTRDNAVTWTGYWEREPSSAAPSNSWGYGWSKGTGFPSTGEVHQQRLVLSGFPRRGSAIVGSSPRRPNDMNALEFIESDDAPLNLEITSGDDSEVIQWLRSANRHLQIGTNKGQYSLRGVPLSVGSIGLEAHSKHGGGPKAGAAASVGPATAYIANNGRTIREMSIEADTGQFVSPNVLAFSSHLLQSGEKFVQIKGVNDGTFPFYALRTSLGRLIFVTRDFENEIAAPAPTESLNPTGVTKTCQDIWVGEGEGDDDVLWAVWKYEATGVIDRSYIYRYTPETHFDGYYIVPTYSANSFSVPPYLIGVTLSVVHGGVYWGEYETGGGGSPLVAPVVPNFPNTTATLEVGEAYQFKATPTVKDLSGPAGTTLSEKRQVNNMRVFLVDSAGGEIVEDNTSQISPVNQRLAAPTTANGWVDVPGVGVNGRDPSPAVTSRFPFAFRVSAIAMEVSI